VERKHWRISLRPADIGTVFNLMARNQDDHVKNIAFPMNKRGEWQLAARI